jgi:hypothetical protein
MRWSIAKIVFRRQTFAPRHRSGGRQPPVDVIPHSNSQRGSASHCICRRGLQTHGGLTPAAPVCACGEDVRVWGRIVVAPTLPRPRRAHARRSCARACAYRKNRHVCGKRTPCTRSGGRQPPVVREPCLQGKFRTRSPTTIAPRRNSGRRKPPRAFANVLTSAFPAHYGRRSPDHAHGGLTHGAVV